MPRSYALVLSEILVPGCHESGIRWLGPEVLVAGEFFPRLKRRALLPLESVDSCKLPGSQLDSTFAWRSFNLSISLNVIGNAVRCSLVRAELATPLLRFLNRSCCGPILRLPPKVETCCRVLDRRPFSLSLADWIELLIFMLVGITHSCGTSRTLCTLCIVGTRGCVLGRFMFPVD